MERLETGARKCIILGLCALQPAAADCCCDFVAGCACAPALPACVKGWSTAATDCIHACIRHSWCSLNQSLSMQQGPCCGGASFHYFRCAHGTFGGSMEACGLLLVMLLPAWLLGCLVLRCPAQAWHELCFQLTVSMCVAVLMGVAACNSTVWRWSCHVHLTTVSTHACSCCLGAGLLRGAFMGQGGAVDFECWHTLCRAAWQQMGGSCVGAWFVKRGEKFCHCGACTLSRVFCQQAQFCSACVWLLASGGGCQG